jgi:hypothetical protein
MIKIKSFYKFNESESFDVLEYLNNIDDSLLKKDLEKLKTTQEKREIIEDILIQIGNIVDDQMYRKIEIELTNKFLKK